MTNKKRSKRIIKEVWENLQIGLGLSVILCLIYFFRLSRWDLETVKEISGSVFAGSLIILSACCLDLTIYSRYIVYQPMKIIMGYTRREIFMDMQWGKFLGAICIMILSGAAVLFAKWPFIETADISIVFGGFVLIMLTQGLVELFTIFSLKSRKLWLSLVAIVAACACAGAFVGYFITVVVKEKNMFSIEFSFQFIEESPLLWLVVFVVVYHLMEYVSWELLKNLEVRM